MDETVKARTETKSGLVHGLASLNRRKSVHNAHTMRFWTKR